MNNILRYLLVPITIIHCCSCKRDDRSIHTGTLNDSINLSLHWQQLKCGLYKNKNRDIALKDIAGFDGSVIDYYISSIDTISLKNVVDTTSFRNIGDGFYKDKRHIYHHYTMAGGGSLWILDKVDYKTFKVINGCYSRDKKHIYSNRGCDILKDADLNSFTAVNSGGCLAKDKKGFFSYDERVNEQEFKNSLKDSKQ